MLEDRWDEVLCHIARGQNLVTQVADMFPETELLETGLVTGEDATKCGVSNNFAIKLLKQMEKRNLVYFIGEDTVKLTDLALARINCKKD